MSDSEWKVGDIVVFKRPFRLDIEVGDFAVIKRVEPPRGSMPKRALVTPNKKGKGDICVYDNGEEIAIVASEIPPEECIKKEPDNAMLHYNVDAF